MGPYEKLNAKRPSLAFFQGLHAWVKAHIDLEGNKLAAKIETTTAYKPERNPT